MKNKSSLQTKKKRLPSETEENHRLSWRKRWDSNPRAREGNSISSRARYDHFDTLPGLCGAGEGNRTPATGLGSQDSTTELHPLNKGYLTMETVNTQAKKVKPTIDSTQNQ